MPVEKDANGRRFVQAEAEVPGTPEQVWDAIATGPGISSWFVPSEVEEKVGGTAISHFGTDNSMDSVAKITEWEPPHRYVAKTEEGPGQVATEWIVESQQGGTCTVRVVHSWFASSDEWDQQFEGHTSGWIAFFCILRQYLTHFPGQHATPIQVMTTSPESTADAWAKYMAGLGFENVAVGDEVTSKRGAPPLLGRVEITGQAGWNEELLVRVKEPAPGLVHFGAFPIGGPVILMCRMFLFGDDAASKAQQVATEWQAWLSETMK